MIYYLSVCLYICMYLFLDLSGTDSGVIAIGNLVRIVLMLDVILAKCYLEVLGMLTMYVYCHK